MRILPTARNFLAAFGGAASAAVVIVAIAAVSLSTACGNGATGSLCAPPAAPQVDQTVTGSIGEERLQPSQPAPSPAVTVMQQTPAAPAPKPYKAVLASTFEAIDATPTPPAVTPAPAPELKARLIAVSDREVTNDPLPIKATAKAPTKSSLTNAAVAPKEVAPKPQPAEPEIETAALAPEPVPAPVEVAPRSDVRTVTGRGANVRAKPARAGAKLFALNGGAEVTVTKSQKGWLYITDERGRKGWLYSTYAE